MTRNWSLGPAAWSWPDDVDETGCEGRMANRYLPIEHTAYGGSGWQVAQVFVDEGDDEMLADARLVMAAPDLLRELKFAVSVLQDNHIARGVAAALAAIRLAEGGADEATPN